MTTSTPPQDHNEQKQTVYVPAYVSLPLQGSVRKQVMFWLGTLGLFIVFLFAFSSILPPFVFGFILAYFLNPIIHLLQKIGVSRVWGTTLITFFIVCIFVILLTIFVPIISVQLQQFISSGLPSYLEKIQVLLSTHDFDWIRKYLGSDPSAVQSNIQAILSYGSDFLKSILSSLLSSGKSIIGFVSFFVVGPVVAFYLLLDWERMVNSVDSWIPRDHLRTIRSLFYEMDRAVAGFIRGQGTVCLILAIYYAASLTILGLNYGLLIGIFIGGIAFIPYIGSVSGLILTLWAAWIQFPDNWILVIVIAIFFFGQFLEGYILQPKLVGSSVGLHPVWLMFSLFAFGSLFGFTGMLVAVPVAAALGSLVRFALYTYLASPLYATKTKQEKDGK